MATKPRQYVVICKPGVGERPAPGGRRTLLSIQNTGSNPGLYRVDNNVRLDGGDVSLGPGAFGPKYDVPETCPQGALNFYSEFGTTFSVTEAVEGSGP